MNFHKFCVILGLVGMAHAAYSAAQHRTYLRLTEQEFTRLPVDSMAPKFCFLASLLVMVQCFVGLLMTCYGVVSLSGNFREIRASAEQDSKTWDMLSNRQAFYSFNHRGKAIFSTRDSNACG